MAAEIRTFPCLSDNFGYLIHDPATKATASIDAPEAGPIIEALGARLDIGLGRREAGCQTIKELASPRSGLPGRLKGEAQLLAGYCAAAAGDAAAAGLAVELASEEGFEAELPLAVLAGVAAATTPKLQLPGRVLLLDYRFLELLGPVETEQLLGDQAFRKGVPVCLDAYDSRSAGPLCHVAVASVEWSEVEYPHTLDAPQALERPMYASVIEQLCRTGADALDRQLGRPLGRSGVDRGLGRRRR